MSNVKSTDGLVSLDEFLNEANERKYERIVKCKFCDTPGLIFDTSKSGNRWLYQATEVLTQEQVDQIREEGRFAGLLREVVLGRDAEGKLGTGFVLVMKHKPHPACRLEAERVTAEVEPVQTGTIEVSVKADGKTPSDAKVDESIDSPYDGDAEPETADEEYGLMGYSVSDDED